MAITLISLIMGETLKNLINLGDKSRNSSSTSVTTSVMSQAHSAASETVTTPAPASVSLEDDGYCSHASPKGVGDPHHLSSAHFDPGGVPPNNLGLLPSSTAAWIPHRLHRSLCLYPSSTEAGSSPHRLPRSLCLSYQPNGGNKPSRGQLQRGGPQNPPSPSVRVSQKNVGLCGTSSTVLSKSTESVPLTTFTESVRLSMFPECNEIALSPFYSISKKQTKESQGWPPESWTEVSHQRSPEPQINVGQKCPCNSPTQKCPPNAKAVMETYVLYRLNSGVGACEKGKFSGARFQLPVSSNTHFLALLRLALVNKCTKKIFLCTTFVPIFGQIFIPPHLSFDPGGKIDSRMKKSAFKTGKILTGRPPKMKISPKTRQSTIFFQHDFMSLRVKIFDVLNIIWKKDEHEIFHNNGRISIMKRPCFTMLQIKEIEITDAGIYTLEIENASGRDAITFLVQVI